MDRQVGMTVGTVCGVLAISVVIAYLFIVVVLAIVPPLFNIGDPKIIHEHMSFVLSLLTGVVGIVIGYYFGKKGS
jgi:hypothetical protein